MQQDKLDKLYQFQKVMSLTRKFLLDVDEEEVLYQKICEYLVQINFIKIAGIVFAH